MKLTAWGWMCAQFHQQTPKLPEETSVFSGHLLERKTPPHCFFFSPLFFVFLSPPLRKCGGLGVLERAINQQPTSPAIVNILTQGLLLHLLGSRTTSGNRCFLRAKTREEGEKKIKEDRKRPLASGSGSADHPFAKSRS